MNRVPGATRERQACRIWCWGVREGRKLASGGKKEMYKKHRKVATSLECVPAAEEHSWGRVKVMQYGLLYGQGTHLLCTVSHGRGLASSSPYVSRKSR